MPKTKKLQLTNLNNKPESFKYFQQIEKFFQERKIKIKNQTKIMRYLADYLGLTQPQISLAYLLFTIIG